MKINLALALAALSACFPQVDFGGTSFACPDGVSCPVGFRCVELVCEDDASEPGADAELPADGAAEPDAEVAGAPPGPMVDVRASESEHGCSRLLDNGACPDDATPRHDVELPAYRIDVHEVSQAEYQRCVLAGACARPRASFDPRSALPVTDVSWDDAVGYCGFAGKRLPSEAEWEHAARGPDELDYPWGEDQPDCARATFAGCGDAPAAIGSHTGDASVFGATEMAGNVAEWVGDFYAADFYDEAPRLSPTGPARGTERVVRGGSFKSPPLELLAWVRFRAAPARTAADIGFRCAQ